MSLDDLINEIEAWVGSTVAVDSISRFLGNIDALETYTGTTGVNFSLVPGEGYLIKVNLDATFVPQHF